MSISRSISMLKDHYTRNFAKASTNVPHLPHNYRRIYHVHIRKTGGTSLNEAFWNLADLQFADLGKRQYFARNGFVFARHRKKDIERGNYFFANSHLPLHQLTIPPNTYLVTVLRDPSKRVVSLYNYLRWIRDDPQAKFEEPYWRELQNEARVVGTSFHDFLTKLHRQELLNQLYMFSRSCEIDEALENLQRCSKVLYTENFKSGLAQLGENLDLPLEEKHARRFGQNYAIELSDSESSHLAELIEPERQFLKQCV